MAKINKMAAGGGNLLWSPSALFRGKIEGTKLNDNIRLNYIILTTLDHFCAVIVAILHVST